MEQTSGRTVNGPIPALGFARRRCPDLDLAATRDRDDFKKLIADLEAANAKEK